MAGNAILSRQRSGLLVDTMNFTKSQYPASQIFSALSLLRLETEIMS